LEAAVFIAADRNDTLRRAGFLVGLTLLVTLGPRTLLDIAIHVAMVACS
jgi:hypothetical protein